MNETSELAGRLLGSPKAATSEDSLLRRLRQRDPEAWTALFEEHRDLIYRVALSQVSDRELAEDITGQVFLEAIQGIHRYRDRGSPVSAWLISIARHRSLDALRKRRREERTSLPVLVGPEQRESPALAALEVLTPEQREVVHLRFVEDLSIEKVAKLTGRSPGAVKSLQHRALRQLRTQLTAITDGEHPNA